MPKKEEMTSRLEPRAASLSTNGRKCSEKPRKISELQSSLKPWSRLAVVPVQTTEELGCNFLLEQKSPQKKYAELRIMHSFFSACSSSLKDEDASWNLIQ